MVAHQHEHHDDVTSASSVEEGWKVEFAEALLIRKMTDLRDKAGSSPLYSLHKKLVFLAEGSPDNIPILQVGAHQRSMVGNDITDGDGSARKIVLSITC